jgi:hypothetical protein
MRCEMREVGTECDSSRRWPSEFVVVLLASSFPGGCFHFQALRPRETNPVSQASGTQCKARPGQRHNGEVGDEVNYCPWRTMRDLGLRSISTSILRLAMCTMIVCIKRAACMMHMCRREIGPPPIEDSFKLAGCQDQDDVRCCQFPGTSRR